MPGKKTGLGRGLDSLITNGNSLLNADASVIAEAAGKAVSMLDIYKVEPDRGQPRKDFDEARLQELAESIRQFGILQPLLVQKTDGAEGAYYRIIAGERRWRAAKLAGLKEVPAIVKEYAPAEIFEISLIENIQREDLNPLEEAKAYERLLKEYGMTHEQMAEHLGKSRSQITNSLRLLSLGDEVQGMVEREEISFGHAKVLMGVEDETRQLELAKRVLEDGLSVRALEALLKDKPVKAVEKKAQEPNAVLDRFASELSNVLGTKVAILPGKRKGKIEIEYYSEEDLVRVSDLLMKIK